MQKKHRVLMLVVLLMAILMVPAQGQGGFEPEHEYQGTQTDTLTGTSEGTSNGEMSGTLQSTSFTLDTETVTRVREYTLHSQQRLSDGTTNNNVDFSRVPVEGTLNTGLSRTWVEYWTSGTLWALNSGHGVVLRSNVLIDGNTVGQISDFSCGFNSISFENVGGADRYEHGSSLRTCLLPYQSGVKSVGIEVQTFATVDAGVDEQRSGFTIKQIEVYTVEVPTGTGSFTGTYEGTWNGTSTGTFGGSSSGSHEGFIEKIEAEANLENATFQNLTVNNLTTTNTNSTNLSFTDLTGAITIQEFSFWLPILIFGGLLLFSIYEGSRAIREGLSRGPWTLIAVLATFGLAAHIIEIPWTTELSLLLLLITVWVYYLARPGEAGQVKQ